MPPPPDESLLVLLSVSLLEELSLLLLEPLLPLPLLLSLPLLLLLVLVPLELLVSEEEPGATHTHIHTTKDNQGTVCRHATAETPTGEKLGGGWRSSLGGRTASQLPHTPDDMSEDEESESELELLLLACLCFFLRAFLRASASAFFFSSSSLGVKRIHSGTSSGSRYLRLDCVGSCVEGEGGEGRGGQHQDDDSTCESMWCAAVLLLAVLHQCTQAAVLTGLCSCLLAEGLAR